jgi:uncharacterized protein (UPF0332 family)
MYQTATALLLTKDIVSKTHSGRLQMLSLHFIKGEVMDKRYFDMLTEAKDLSRKWRLWRLSLLPVLRTQKKILKNAKDFIEEAKRILSR